MTFCMLYRKVGGSAVSETRSVHLMLAACEANMLAGRLLPSDSVADLCPMPS